MALRSLARGTWAPSACALRCRSGAGIPAAALSRFLATIRNQNGVATRRFCIRQKEEEFIRRVVKWATRDINDGISTRDLLKRAKKVEKISRVLIKWGSRGFKAVEWACYFCVSVTAATAVMVNKP